MNFWFIPKANVMKRPCFAPAAMSANHCSASSSASRGEKTAVVTPFHGCGGARVARSFPLPEGAGPPLPFPARGGRGPRGVGREPLPVVAIRLRDRSVFDDVADVGVSEDPVLGQVRRARPDGLGHAVAAEDEELVVHQLAVHAPAAER